MCIRDSPSTAASAERLPASCKGWASSATPAKMPRNRWGAILTAAATNARYSARLHSRPNSNMPWKPSPIMRASVMPVSYTHLTPYGFSGLNTLRAAGVPNPPPPFAQRFIACFCSQTAAASQSKSAYILSSLESSCILCSLLRYFHILSKKLQKTC